AADRICSKRLVPFLPELIDALERHGHLQLEESVRQRLCSISPATVDRLLHQVRYGSAPKGISTTRPGSLLKHQIPVRTFADWDDLKPGFFEADLVAHCGTVNAGSYLNTLTMTDVDTGWTECLSLLVREQDIVVKAIEAARRLIPFPMLGLDTDNGKEFINHTLLDYCRRESITFTRSRPYKKNDQCHVEQKNGSIVRRVVGYDRFEGLEACRILSTLYQRLRLYVIPALAQAHCQRALWKPGGQEVRSSSNALPAGAGLGCG
ncbi:MAG: transposase family protein, partial [Bacteroidetes bacterium]|nr:transposase family protein [Bacteroidota bacterium]